MVILLGAGGVGRGAQKLDAVVIKNDENVKKGLPREKGL